MGLNVLCADIVLGLFCSDVKICLLANTVNFVCAHVCESAPVNFQCRLSPAESDSFSRCSYGLGVQAENHPSGRYPYERKKLR